MSSRDTGTAVSESRQTQISIKKKHLTDFRVARTNFEKEIIYRFRYSAYLSRPGESRYSRRTAKGHRTDAQLRISVVHILSYQVPSFHFSSSLKIYIHCG